MAALCLQSVDLPAQEGQDFAHQIAPILSEKCFHCHGPDKPHRPTDLRLDTEAGVREAFAGGDFEASEAWRRITSEDPDEMMPPPDTHKPFTKGQRQAVREWMEKGAAWSPHWAFVPPVKPAPPTGFSEHPIDAFVRRKLVAAALEPSPRASRETLIRRATFDLHGLPPTPEEIDAFVSDERPDAWRRLIDRLLASPRYGERMAVAWLDGARYADTNGYQNDFSRTMWPWRDWVIQAYNRNMPFDAFTIEQLAGDLLPNATHDQRLATAFNRNNRTVTESGSIPDEWLVENVVDRVETTSTVFLGLTVGCARCHDHKFDPVTQEEFYEFFSFFYNVEEQGVYDETRGNVGPTVSCPTDQQRTELQRLEQREGEALAQHEALAGAARRDAAAWFASASPPPPQASAAMLPLDSASFAAVAEGESIIEPSREDYRPTLEDSFLGKVASFDGSKWLEYTGLYSPERDRPFTIAAWVLRRGDGAVLSKIHDGEAFRGIDWLFNQNGLLSVHLISHWPADALKVTTESPLPVERWTPITVAYDGSGKASGVAIYFGTDQQQLTVNEDRLVGSLQTDQPWRIGRRSGGSDFRGAVGKVRIFDRTLGRDEIRAVITRDLLKAPSVGASRTHDVALKPSGASDQDPKSLAPAALAPELVAHYSLLAPDAAGRRYAKADANLAAARRSAEEFRQSIASCMVMKELPEPRQAYVLSRGEYDKPDKARPVSAAVPGFLGKLPTERNDRLALAEWIVSRDNPLTARVVANRMWGRLFGVGLVKTEENFGVQCDPPSHPYLLDWLAVELIDSGWDLQHLMRLIMTSETYQQSSVASAEAYAEDPENRRLARGPRRRLPAEFIRDNALALSGLLNEQIGGPSVKPYQPQGLWEELAGGAGEGPYVLAQGADLYRRSLYTYRKRTVPHPTMAIFDAPSFELCTVKRTTTNTPLQALALLNDTTYVEAARELAERLLREGGADDEARVRFGFRTATSRQPTDDELRLLSEALARYREAYAADADARTKLIANGSSPPDSRWDPTDLAALTTLSSLLLNLDETITVE